jgi:hypothetical protein
MSGTSLFLAQIDPKDGLVPDLKTVGAHGGLTFLFVAVGIVTLLILIWAIFIRKRPDESSRRYKYPSRGTATGAQSEPIPERSGRRRRRKRRPRNPTLAESGGLPPLRADGYTDDPP